MTKPSIALTDLLEKGADADLLREMISHIVEQVMQFDVENLCAAGYGQRTPERQNSRNGYRERLWETRAGSIAVKIPKLRTGSYFPPFLEPRRTAEKALAAVVQEAYVQGVSTRSVDELVATLSACAGHDWQRTGYETLESYGQAQCRKTMGEACEKREPYDRYQHKLRESEKKGSDR